MKNHLFQISLIFSILSLSFQGYAQLKSTIMDGQDRIDLFNQYQEMRDTSPYKDLSWKFVGPTNISGRCTDVEGISPRGESYTIWIATASGGVWKSTNEATTFEPVFEDLPTASIGDLAIDSNNEDVVWVGTGEANIFRSSNAGCGLYKTEDGGESWNFMGLGNTNTIARIKVDPRNSDVVYVAAGGREWTNNEERGLFKTVDGGKSWNKILYLGEGTGANDLVLDPSNPDIIYCSTWERKREKWNDPRTYPSTQNSGIWKSEDGGENWKKINNGLPAPNHLGRIGIDIAASNPKVLYAYVDNYEVARKAEPGQMNSYGLPAQDVIKGATVYRSNDGGENWTQVSGLTEEQKRYMETHSGTYGWVFSQIRVDPNDENRVYTMGLFLNVSTDGGKTFKPLRGMHVDHHGLWIDPNQSNYLLNVQDGGLAISYDYGENWKTPIEQLPLAQFFTLEYDMEEPFNVYGSIQDHGSYKGTIDLSRGVQGIRPVEFPRALGGEGTNHAIDFRDNTIYASSFYGSVQRLRPTDERRKVLLPEPYPEEEVLRGQWLAPTELSTHNPDIVYHGMQYLLMSRDQGDTWEKISPNLTNNNPDELGDISYQTLTAISESPRRFGLIYVGTDDGNIWRTKDGGKTWDDIRTGDVPVKWVSRMVASEHDLGTVYLAQTGRRDDDFQVYLWKSTDFGETWTDISGNIPLGGVNVIREDPTDPNILYVGSDVGVFVSKNGGESWEVLGQIPFVYVHDLQIHPRENVLLIGTHGRGVWILEAGYVNKPSEYKLGGGAEVSASKEEIDQLVGKWVLSANVGGNNTDLKLELTSSDKGLEGILSTQFGDAELSDINFDGKTLRFSATFDMMGQVFILKGSGEVNGNEMKGTLANEMMGESPFSGNKE